MRTSFNSPVIISFTLLAALVLLFDQISSGKLIPIFFAAYPGFEPFSPIYYFRLTSYPLGHANWAHFAGNFMFILVVGPLVEEKYGSGALLGMMALTASLTGILNAFLFSTGLVGASGLVFMLIILSSFTNIRKGEIPVTFILIALLYLTNEVMNSLKEDNISQFGHLMGAAFGGIFGFLFPGKNRR